jgi:hypothetical protein
MDGLDDFKENVNRRFDQVDKRFDRVEADIRELRTTMKQGFDSMHRTMIIGFVSMFGTIVSAMVAAMAFS